jgi:hypothetical protein
MTDFWDFDNNQRRRHRFEHSHLTMGMWATTGMHLHPPVFLPLFVPTLLASPQ